MLKRLIEKIQSKNAVIGVVGLGYVGQPLAFSFATAGFKVIGFDIDQTKVRLINQGISSIGHLSNELVAEANAAGMISTTDFSLTSEVDVLILCLPTPLNKFREPDLSYVISTVDTFVTFLRPGQALVLESTTYPGTTEEELLPRVESSGVQVGEDFFLIYSPEREDPGNTSFVATAIPKVVGGHTSKCLEVATTLYGQVMDKVVPVSSTRTAEMVKLLENIHRSVNIGLANEMKVVADRMGLDIFEVIEAAATKPFGFTPYYPGPGLGGHCIPIDPFYLTWKAREFGLHTRFIELAGEINRSMPEYVFGKLVAALNHRSKAVKGAKILVLGLAYKKNIEDTRESPSVELMALLREAGAELAYSDPHVPVFPAMRQYSFDLESVALTPALLGTYDAVVLATDHDSFDYQMIRASASLIIDTRGKYRDSAENIMRA